MMQLKQKETLSENVKHYWNVRSDSYSRQNIEEMNCFKRDAWRDVILEQAPQKECLRILDVGTGPGFFAINLALCGHEVAAVDMTPGMLEKASHNAHSYGAFVRFEQADAQHLPFDDESFDLVISRNVVWNLEQPEEALAEWRRVLCDGGRMVYFDANWYLYLYDDALRQTYEWAQRTAPAQPTALGNRMEKLAAKLPLSDKVRPQWDRQALEEIGMKVLTIDQDVCDRVWDDDEIRMYAYAPMFMVVAER